MPLTSSGYSFRASNTDSINGIAAGGDLTGTYPNPMIANNAVTTAKIADQAVTQAKLAPGVSLPPGGSAGGDLTGTYPSPSIATGAVNTTKLADNAVSTAKIADQAVTQAKLATDAVDNTKIKDGEVKTNDLANASVTYAKISPAGGNNNQVLKIVSGSVQWAPDYAGGLTLPYSGSAASGIVAFDVTLSSSGTHGYLASTAAGAYGSNGHGNSGYLGGTYGAYGVHSNGNYGYLGGADAAAYGTYILGNYGLLGSSQYGAYGKYNNGNEGALAGADFGAYGKFYNGNYGLLGTAAHGVYGYSSNGTGVYGASASASGYGVRGYSSSGFAGYFEGNVNVTGNFTVGGTKHFKIDHPLDPANKYLVHFCVESDEVLNIYNGNVVLDANGEAWVELPAYFEALNKDFRYQLTAIGAPGPNLYIAQKISGNRFKIAGGTPGMEVSWQVTGIRNDPYLKAHPAQVEVEKTGKERGKYIHPKEYGVSETLGIDYEEHQKMEAEQAKMQAEQERMKAEQERMQKEVKK